MPGNRENALPLSLLNDYLYCPRRAGLKIVEGWREANVHTERGDIVHEHSDLQQPGDFDLSETMRRAKQISAAATLKVAADDLVAFLRSVPKKTR